MSNTDWLTLVLVIITGFYAWATLRILRANEAMVAAMRSQQDAAMRPFVEISVHLRTGTQLLYLRIRNTGKTGATNLNLSLDKDFYQLGDKRPERNLANTSAFTQSIDGLAPGAQLLFLLGNGPSLFQPKDEDLTCPLTFSVTATYSWDSTSVTERSTIDLRPYLNTDVPHDPIVEELKKLKEQLQELRQLRDIKRVAERAFPDKDEA